MVAREGGLCTCQVEVRDGGLGPQGGHHVRMQAAQVMVSPVASTPGSSQVELTGQRGSSSHAVHLGRQQCSQELRWQVLDSSVSRWLLNG